jgi:hypothetical protein
LGPAWRLNPNYCWLFAEVKKPAEAFSFSGICALIYNSYGFCPKGFVLSETRADNKLLIQDHPNDYLFLLPRHIQMIDKNLHSLGEYGEVRLVVEMRRLLFLVTKKSYDTLKRYPGILVKDIEP